MLDLEQERELVARAAAGETRARQRLIQSHLRLVMKIARCYQRGGIPIEDLVGEGIVGLLEALRRFDDTRGVRFAGYAAWWIRARIGQYALANRRLVTLPSTRNARLVLREGPRVEEQLARRLRRSPSRDELAQALGVPVDELSDVRAALHAWDVSVDQPLCADEDDSPEQQLLERQAERQLRERVDSAMQGLSDRERVLVNEQYLSDEGRSLAELGETFGVSRQRLGQVLSNAREKLRTELVRVA